MPDLSSSLPRETADFYRRTLSALNEADVPYLVTGAYALARYTGIERHTKDIDLFLQREDLPAALAALEPVSDRTEKAHAHWIGKAYYGDDTVDLIHRNDSGVVVIDSTWFEHAPEDEVLGVPIRLCPPEELLLTKSFVMERERYDGADVIHLLHARGTDFDWPRLLRRFGSHWRLLLSHLMLFQYIYPGEQRTIPSDVMQELLDRLQEEDAEQADRLCRGTLISRSQYRFDVEKRGYRDARLPPHGRLSQGEVEAWTAAADAE